MSVDDALNIYKNISKHFGDKNNNYNYSVPMFIRLVPIGVVSTLFKIIHYALNDYNNKQLTCFLVLQ